MPSICSSEAIEAERSQSEVAEARTETKFETCIRKLEGGSCGTDPFVCNDVRVAREDLQKMLSTALQPIIHSMERAEANIAHIAVVVGAVEDEDVYEIFTTHEPTTMSSFRESDNKVHFSDEHIVQTVEGEGGTEEHDSSQKRHSYYRHDSKGMNALLSEAGAVYSSAGRWVRDMIARSEIAKFETGSNKNVHLNKIVLERFLEWAGWWETLREPDRSGVAYCIVQSNAFETITMLVIFLNSVAVAIEADWQMNHLHQETPPFLRYGNIGFFVYFFLELIIRLAAHRLYFFCNHDLRWNWLDFCLVIVTGFDIIGEFVLNQAAGGNNVVFMRILRFIKVARVFRAFRAIRLFKDLNVMMESFANSIIALFWTLVMLGFMLYLFSLVFLQGLADKLRNDEGNLPESVVKDIEHYFGSLTTSMLSLCMAVTGGDDWNVFYSVLSHGGTAQCTIFLFFLFFFNFSLFNILTGLFVEKAVAAARPDTYDQVMLQRKKAQQDSEEFFRLCCVLDKDKSGTISWEEFETMMQNATMVAYMASIGLQVHEVEVFFRVVCGSAEKGEISISRFVEGCMQMKGTATGIDVQKQLFEIHMLHEDVRRFERETIEYMKRLEAVVTLLSTPKLPRRSASRGIGRQTSPTSTSDPSSPSLRPAPL